MTKDNPNPTDTSTQSGMEELVKCAMPQDIGAVQDTISASLKYSDEVISQTLKNSYHLINQAAQQLHGQPAQSHVDSTNSSADVTQATTIDKSQAANKAQEASPESARSIHSHSFEAQMKLVQHQMESAMNAVQSSISQAESQMQQGMAIVDRDVAKAVHEQASAVQEQDVNNQAQMQSQDQEAQT